MLSKYVSVSLINELFLTMCICVYVYAFIFALNFETFIDACFCAPVERGWDAGHGTRGTCVWMSEEDSLQGLPSVFLSRGSWRWNLASQSWCLAPLLEEPSSRAP